MYLGQPSESNFVTVDTSAHCRFSLKNQHAPRLCMDKAQAV
ncbi:hypothetical protein BIFGAL_03395 [Bifidobacterium gallicum DSM 20093 = LMG 11596]|uniref:Uncharacterized protein n=1 Tax=Bifidobacterium gallicum DSM 20093 = LMG 11596 TaxID=561180 RepID=D1NU74_9BIFI|nr:hypothetical protein BIFGAL_03395 [Bifidobacterium gallicum DSM 20093 = LMG 11596]